MNDEEIVEYIRNNFTYENGELVRHDRKNSSGSYDKDGYKILKIKGRQIKEHRAVFAYFNGRFPNKEIDHINGIRDDNRIENLRECSRVENVLNTDLPPNDITGKVGIYYDKTKGLKKNYAFRFRGKIYRFYTVNEAVDMKEKLRNDTYGDYFKRQSVLSLEGK